MTEEDEDNEDGIRFVTLESRFENKETVLQCSKFIFGFGSTCVTRCKFLGAE